MSDHLGRREPGIIPFRGMGLEKSGGPPDPPDIMGMRIARLEEDMKEVRTDIKSMTKDMAFLRGRLEHLPTTWTLVGTIAVSQVTLLGFVFTMMKYLGH